MVRAGRLPRMVRREEAERAAKPRGEVVRCTSPAGASPVPVGAGAPGSRPQVSGREAVAQAGRQEPLRREQERGPQHEVKPAASTEKQSGSRAAHVTAKATPAARESGCVTGSGGIRGAARVQGGVWHTRGPSARPTSGRGESHKPSAKTAAAQRESEGIVVPTMDRQKNLSGGRGPCGGHVVNGGKREGMVGQGCRSNHPGGQGPDDKVRRLQRRLGASRDRRQAVCGKSACTV